MTSKGSRTCPRFWQEAPPADCPPRKRGGVDRSKAVPENLADAPAVPRNRSAAERLCVLVGALPATRRRPSSLVFGADRQIAGPEFRASKHLPRHLGIVPQNGARRSQRTQCRQMITSPQRRRFGRSGQPRVCVWTRSHPKQPAGSVNLFLTTLLATGGGKVHPGLGFTQA